MSLTVGSLFVSRSSIANLTILDKLGKFFDNFGHTHKIVG